MTEFEQRLKKAVERGQARSRATAHEARQRAMSEEELKGLHSKARLQLSDHIEKCVSQLPDHFPGFRSETIFGERGWGAAVSRDDLGRGDGGKRVNHFSRMEMTVRPYSNLRVLELAAKGTVRNKELFNRTHYEKLEDADLDSFHDLIDVWVLEFAELYAANR